MSERSLRSRTIPPVAPVGSGSGRGGAGRGDGGRRGRGHGTLPVCESESSAGVIVSTPATSELTPVAFIRVPIPTVMLAAASDVNAASSVAATTHAATAAVTSAATAPMIGAAGSEVSGVAGVVRAPDPSESVAVGRLSEDVHGDELDHDVAASDGNDEASEIRRVAAPIRRRIPAEPMSRGRMIDADVVQLMREVATPLTTADHNLLSVYTEPGDVRSHWPMCTAGACNRAEAVHRLRSVLLDMAFDRYSTCSPAEKEAAIRRAAVREGGRARSLRDPPVSDTYWADRDRARRPTEERESVRECRPAAVPRATDPAQERESRVTEVREERVRPPRMRVTAPMSPLGGPCLPFQLQQPCMGFGSQFPLSQGFCQYPSPFQPTLVNQPPFAAPYGLGTVYGPGGGFDTGFGGGLGYGPNFQPMQMRQPLREAQPRAEFPARAERPPVVSVADGPVSRGRRSDPVPDIEARVAEMAAERERARPPVVGGDVIRERDDTGGRARVEPAPTGMTSEGRRASDASLITFPPEQVHERRMPDTHELETIRNQFSRLSIPMFDGRQESYAGWKLQFTSSIQGLSSEVNMEQFLLDPPNFMDWCQEDYAAYVSLARMISSFLIRVLGATLVTRYAYFTPTTIINPHGMPESLRCIHPAAIWQSLEQTFANYTTVASMGYFAQLSQLAMGGRETIDEYISRVFAILTRLQQTGQQIGENVACMYLIRGLPERHRWWVTQQHTNDQQMRWDAITRELRNAFLLEANLVRSPRADFPKKFKARAVMVKDQTTPDEKKCSHCGKRSSHTRDLLDASSRASTF